MSHTLNTDALDYFLARGYISAPWTLLREVGKIPSSHALDAKVGGDVKVARYAWPTGKPKISPSTEERNSEIDRLFRQSLKRRVAPDSRTAVGLSGGVDSALLTAGLVKLLGEKPDTFTFEYSDYDGVFNESGEAARIAKYFGVPHYRVLCRPQHLADRASALVAAYGEPFSYGLHSFLLDGVMPGTNPILTGTGVEPWAVNRSTYMTLRVKGLPAPLRFLALQALASARPFAPKFVDRADNLVWAIRNGLPSALAPSLMRDAPRHRLFADPELGRAGTRATYDVLRTAMADFKDESDLDQFRFLQQRSFGAEGVYAWYTAWSHGYDLQVRHPFLDDDFNAYMMRINLTGIGKISERAYAATIMPEEFAHAPKVYHTIPIASWFRGPMRDFISSLLESRELEGVFNRQEVQNLLTEHLSGRADHGFTLWGLASFALWSEQVMHTRARAEAALV